MWFGGEFKEDFAAWFVRQPTDDRIALVTIRQPSHSGRTGKLSDYSLAGESKLHKKLDGIATLPLISRCLLWKQDRGLVCYTFFDCEGVEDLVSLGDTEVGVLKIPTVMKDVTMDDNPDSALARLLNSLAQKKLRCDGLYESIMWSAKKQKCFLVDFSEVKQLKGEFDLNPALRRVLRDC